MSIRNLDALFDPRGVALIGASRRDGSLGQVIRRRLVAAGLGERLHLVNPRYDRIEGVVCHATTGDIGAPVDLGIIVAPARAVPDLIEQLGQAGGRAAVVITAGITGLLREQMLAAARPYLLRLLGPNCIGFQRPSAHLDASFAHLMPQDGPLALVSQSGAIVTAMLDWAQDRDIGFSTVASLGDMADIDLGDMLDYLAGDRRTGAILLYIEHVTQAPKFMSAARRAARIKPVIAIKAGRSEAAARAATSHTGALMGRDTIYGAALKRAGLLRVKGLEELFEAAEILSRGYRVSSGRLTVVTNGGGAGVLAVDAASDAGVEMADLDGATLNALDGLLPHTWSRANPVDIIGDARDARYRAALDAVLADSATDAVLVMNCPTALASSEEAAIAVAETEAARPAQARRHKPILASWLGGQGAARASRHLRGEGIPTFTTPAHAVRGFSYLVDHDRARRQSMRMPPAIAETRAPDRAAVARILDSALGEDRRLLTEPEAKAVLAAYAIPTVATRIARTPEAAGEMAARLFETRARLRWS